MSVSIRKGSVWNVLEEINYFDGSSWRQIEEIQYFNGVIWMSVFSSCVKATYDCHGSAGNLRNFLNSLGIMKGNVEVTLTGSFYGNPAFRTGNLSPFKNVHIISRAVISSVGGGGGNGDVSYYGKGRGANGGAGGTALMVDSPVQITNYGVIRGGGGGGGGGASAHHNEVGGRINFSRGGNGGRGASYGSGSVGGQASQKVGSGRPARGGNGGHGGGFGANGSSGGGASYGRYLGRPGSGGARGKAIVGNAKVSWLRTGTRQGAVT